MKTRHILKMSLAVLMAATIASPSLAADKEATPVKVTADTYVRADSDRQFKTYVDNLGSFGKFFHNRKPYDVNDQVTVRANRDTLYSFGVFDLNSPVTITLPGPDGRYQCLMPISQDHSITAYYGPKEITLTKELIGTRYVFLAIRTFMDPNDEADVKVAHQLQDAIVVKQADKGSFKVPNWDNEGIETLRTAVNVLGASMSDWSTFFGKKDELDPIHHMMGVAVGWGGLPREAAIYTSFYPEKNDGKTAYTLTLKDVPVDAFWSVTFYDADGWMPINEYNAYSFNGVTSERNEDGSVTIHFGGDPKQPNYFPLVKGWNYLVRQYRPRKELLEGKWKLPEPVEVK